MVKTAKLNSLEPYSYLHIFLSKRPDTEVVEDIEALLPW
ncbi:transposase domain-containing protein [Vibrio splendidus]|nr:transposase domain-containing protein [Vibrio splendidus]MDH5918538.1 transposase domain-containing protein [Vibrio splendidus]